MWAVTTLMAYWGSQLFGFPSIAEKLFSISPTAMTFYVIGTALQGIAFLYIVGNVSIKITQKDK